VAIRHVRVKNFRSFGKLDTGLQSFNVIIGSNASGKSNFIKLFEFLRDIPRHGLDNAISLQGGVEYLRNLNIGGNAEFVIEVMSDLKPQESGIFGIGGGQKRLVGLRPREVTYKLTLSFHKKGLGFVVEEERITQKSDVIEIVLEEKRRAEKTQELGSGTIVITNSKGQISVESDLPTKEPISEDAIVPRLYAERELGPKSLLMEHRFAPVPDLFGGIAIYDFDPKLPKKAAPITGRAELEQDGANLAIVLQKIIRDRNKLRKFSNLAKDLLPYVMDVDVEKYADKSLLFTMKESYNAKKYIPASLVSDGTINIACLIIALYFEEKPIAIFEEPERNMHPSLVAKIINMMRDASNTKQIIATTHNPEFVKHAALDSLLLVHRDSEGFSTVTKPADKKSVRTFLENEMGIEDLYVGNLLGLDA